MDNISSHLSSALEEIGARFLLRLEKQVAEIEVHTENLSAPHMSNAALKSIGEICHKISGLAKSVGHPNLGKIASDLDTGIHRYLTEIPEARKIDALTVEAERFVEYCHDNYWKQKK